MRIQSRVFRGPVSTASRDRLPALQAALLKELADAIEEAIRILRDPARPRLPTEAVRLACVEALLDAGASRRRDRLVTLLGTRRSDAGASRAAACRCFGTRSSSSVVEAE